MCQKVIKVEKSGQKLIKCMGKREMGPECVRKYAQSGESIRKCAKKKNLSQKLTISPNVTWEREGP
jgi:hypothetical protein